MTTEEKLYFRDRLRDARAIALQDAEAFDAIIHVLEQIGSFLRGMTKETGSLHVYKESIGLIADDSPLTSQIPSDWQELHISFSTLYDLVKDARNKAMHEGAFARHLTVHAIELSIILEHALMMNDPNENTHPVGHFMVRNPISAAKWQPLSFIRQSMLTNSFSYLPVLIEGDGRSGWGLVSDLILAQYFQAAISKSDLRARLTLPLEQFLKSENVRLHKPNIYESDTPILEVMKEWNGLPALVQSKHSKELLGILTPFDLL